MGVTETLLSSELDTWWNSFTTSEYHDADGEIPAGAGPSPTMPPSLLVPDIADDSEFAALLSMLQPAQAINTNLPASAEGLSTSAELNRRQPHVDEQDGVEGLDLTGPGQSRTPEFQPGTSRYLSTHLSWGNSASCAFRRINLPDHSHSSSSNNSRLPCPSCEMTFTKAFTLNRHQRNETPSRIREVLVPTCAVHGEREPVEFRTGGRFATASPELQIPTPRRQLSIPV